MLEDIPQDRDGRQTCCPVVATRLKPCRLTGRSILCGRLAGVRQCAFVILVNRGGHRARNTAAQVSRELPVPTRQRHLVCIGAQALLGSLGRYAIAPINRLRGTAMTHASVVPKNYFAFSFLVVSRSGRHRAGLSVG